MRGGEILLLPANWLHHVITEPSLPEDDTSSPGYGEAAKPELSVSVNLWRKCPVSCNFAMGHIGYSDDRSQPLPMRRLRLQAFITAVTRNLLLRQESLAVGERVMVVYPGPGRNRYPAVLKQQLGIGRLWQIELCVQLLRLAFFHILVLGSPLVTSICKRVFGRIFVKLKPCWMHVSALEYVAVLAGKMETPNTHVCHLTSSTDLSLQEVVH